MIYGKKKKVPPIVEDQPTTNYGIKLCLQLWKTNHHGNGPQHILPALTEVEDGGLVAVTQGGHGEAGYWVS